jgi:hypothetical protein
LYWLSMMLKGIDPRTARYTIFPPSMGTKDEMMRAQVQLAHATTVNYLLKSFSLGGKIPSIQWVLRYIMGMDEEAIDALDLKDVIQPAAGGAGMKNDPPANDPKEHAIMIGVAQANPDVLEATDHLQWMLEERAIEMRTPKAMAWLRQRSHYQPFQGQFEQIVRMLGITELRKVGPTQPIRIAA